MQRTWQAALAPCRAGTLLLYVSALANVGVALAYAADGSAADVVPRPRRFLLTLCHFVAPQPLGFAFVLLGPTPGSGSSRDCDVTSATAAATTFTLPASFTTTACFVVGRLFPLLFFSHLPLRLPLNPQGEAKQQHLRCKKKREKEQKKR